MTQISNNNLIEHFQKLFQAKNELLVCSPYISQNYIENFIDLCQKNVKVKIVTTFSSMNAIRLELVRGRFKNKTAEFFEFKILEKLHAKIYISDDDYAIHGSANLTRSGLERNIEQISILDEKNEINELKKIFKDIWKMKSEQLPYTEEEYQKRKIITLEERRKINPNSYALWTDDDDEFLKKFWNDESIKLSRNQKIQKLMKKLGRNYSSINSRLRKKGLD